MSSVVEVFRDEESVDMPPTASMEEIVRTLSNVDCSSKVEKKGNLTYLSWAWAGETLLSHFPDSYFEVLEEEYFCFGDNGDTTVMVGVSLTVCGHKRKMWLPVMDNRNNAIKNPNARDISDARMRCLVKVIAMFGLGLYIYAGEDLPSVPTPADGGEPQRATKSATIPASKDVRADVLVFEVFLEDMHDRSTLDKFWLDNKEALARIKDSNKSEYDKVLNLFKAAAKNADAS